MIKVMANYCMNTVDITGEKEKVKKLAIALRDSNKEYKNNLSLGFSNFCDLVLGNTYTKYENGDWTYGTKWWDLSVESYSDGSLTLSGTSAWSPPMGFIEQLSKVFNVDASIEYSEDGFDTSGRISYSNGELISEEEY
jgi:hypothetical protein